MNINNNENDKTSKIDDKVILLNNDCVTAFVAIYALVCSKLT